MKTLVSELPFDRFYAEHLGVVRRQLIRRGVHAADLDDVTQEAFVTIHRLLPEFEGRSSIETWLHSVTWRVAANYRRHARVRNEGASEGVAPDPAAFSSAAHEPIGAQRLRRAFAAMGEEHRDVFALHEIGGFSLAQISELTGHARATIRERLERGRTAVGRAIWKRLTDHDQHEWLERLAADFAEPHQSSASPASAPIVRAQTAIATLGDIVLVVWRGPLSVEALKPLAQVAFDTAHRCPGGFRYLNVVESSSTPPSRQARQLMAWLGAKLGEQVRAYACAVEDSGLMRLVAPIMNSSFFIGGVPIDMRFFNAVVPAASWIASYGPPSATDIAAAVTALRQRLDQECRQ